MASLQDIGRVLFIGIGATAVLDIWRIVLGRVGVPTLNFAFLGRWVGHLLRGKFSHAAIARAPPAPSELAWGWLAHYAIGIAFAAVFVGWMGAGFASSKTATPLKNVLRSVASHAVFGLGFYLSSLPIKEFT